MDWYEIDRWLTVIACAIVGVFGPIGVGLIVYQWALLAVHYN